MNGSHKYLRETVRWGTYGKDGKGPLTWILIKDIHDDHLANIIPFIIQHRDTTYSADILRLMIDEQEYREIKRIRVPFKFGK
jgi:hypothetical protein